MRIRSTRLRQFGSAARQPMGLEPLESRNMLAAMPLISEFMAANDGLLADQDGDFSDWIELFNAGDAPANLTGWHLTDDDDELDRWTFPAGTTLAPGEYRVVFASGKDSAIAGELHTNFSLGSDGEFLALVNGSTPVSQFAPEYPPQRSNISYGIAIEPGNVHLNDLRYFSPPTPGAINGLGYLGVTATPVFSVPHGFYSSTQNVGISSGTGGAVIRYTLDGTTPTASSPNVYSAPLDISHIAVVRAAAFAPGYLPSTVETQTYLFATDLLTQVRPPTYPTSWGTAPAFPTFGLPAFPTPADYDIDPEIVNNPAYTADFLSGLTSIPSVSVVMNPDDLFGSSAGIYSHPWERGEEWERATSVELITPAGGSGFQIDAGVRILGNASRQPMLSPKHSLRIEFRSQYGESELDYPLFGPDNVSTFDSLVVRAELSDSWVSPQGSHQVLTFVGSQGRPRAQYIRDNFARETQLAMGQLAPKSIYVHLFLNGLYWGMHDLIERRDENFVASHLGGAPEDYDVLQDDVFGDSGLIVEGDTVAWDAMFALANVGLANNAQYQQIQQYLDIDAFIDYMHLHLYVGSQDWPYNNWTAMRKREPTGKFQFFTWDAEYTLQDPTIDRTGVNDAASPGQLFAALRNNADFRLKFADRAHFFMFNDGLLTEGPSTTRYLALINQIEDPLVAESARWGDYRRDVHQFIDTPFELSTRDNQWLTEKTRLLEDYFPDRTGNVIEDYKAAGLYPNVVAPAFNQHGGQVATGFSLSITAPASTIYFTLDGSDPHNYSEVGLAALEYQTPVTITQSTRVNARVRSGGVWSALNTADFLVSIPQLRITELMYNPVAPPPGLPVDKEEFEFVEVQNVGPAPLDLDGIVLTEGMEFAFPNETLAVGEIALIVENQLAFESRYGSGFRILGQYDGKLSNGGEFLTLLDGLNQEIQRFEFDDGWYPTTDGNGYSLVIRDAAAALTAWGQATGWRASTNLQGSPGVVDPASIVGRHLFYNQSTFDGNNTAVNAGDDAAIATDKSPYLPGSGAATFANVSSYTKGINGIMIDILGAHGEITLADFAFRVGNNNAPASWADAPTPSAVTVRAGAGVNGSDRVVIAWDNGVIQKRWLEVIVNGNDTLGGDNLNTGLATSNVFFWGNAVGDSGAGNSAIAALTNATDEIATRNATLVADATITNRYDYDRNGEVSQTDQLTSRNNSTIVANALRFLLIAAGGPFAPEVEALATPAASNNALDGGAIASALAVTAPQSAERSARAPAWMLAVARAWHVDRAPDPAHHRFELLARALPSVQRMVVGAGKDGPDETETIDDALLAVLAAE